MTDPASSDINSFVCQDAWKRLIYSRKKVSRQKRGFFDIIQPFSMSGFVISEKRGSFLVCFKELFRGLVYKPD